MPRVGRAGVLLPESLCYDHGCMDAQDAKAYVDRGWAAAEGRKREYWAREFAQRGSGASLDASHTLWQHMRLLRPDWPSDEERRSDLAHHLGLKRLIERAAGAFVSLAGR